MSDKYLFSGAYNQFKGNTRNRLVRLNTDGTEDTAFYTNLGTGFNNEVSFVYTQPDGKILCCGIYTSFNGNSRRLVRLNSNGTEDTGFLGSQSFSAQTLMVQIQPDNKIIVCGDFNSVTGATGFRKIARLNQDGSVDNTFITTGEGLNPQGNFAFNAIVRNILLQPDGKIVAGGGFVNYGANSSRRLARLNSDGSIDTVFRDNLGTGFNAQVFGISIQSDNKLLIAGEFGTFNGNSRAYLVRLNADGTEDTAFYTNLGTGFNATVDVVVVQPDGKLLVSGFFTSFNGNTRNRLVRLNPDGTEDTAFYTNLGTGFNERIVFDPIFIQPDNKILVGGRYTELNGNTRNRLVRLNADGTEDTAFYTNLGTGFNASVHSVAPSAPYIPPLPCNNDDVFEFSGSNITYQHNLGKRDILASIYDDNGYQIQPNSLSASLNDIKFDFTFPTSGSAVVQPADYSQSFTSATSVNVSHSLGTANILVNTFDNNNTLVFPNSVTVSGSNNVIVDFTFPTTGYVSVLSAFVSHSFTAVTESVFVHFLDTKDILVAVYDSGGVQIIPDDIQIINDNSVKATFSSATTGKIVVDRVCRLFPKVFIGSASISQSDTTCVPITVGDAFENILTWQGTIDFDPNVLQFISASNNNIGLTLFNPIPGNLTFSWISPYLTGSTFASGSTLLELCFSGSNSGSSSIGFTDFPTDLEMTDQNGSVLSTIYYTGSIDVAPLPLPPSTSVYISESIISQSNGVCVPITVGDGFQNVLTWQGTIDYNPFVLDYVGVSNNNLGITLFNPASGSLTFSFISPFFTGSTFSSGSTLFEICFTGSVGGYSELAFTGTPTLLEMSDQSGSIFDVDYYTGSILVQPLTSSDVDVTLYLFATSSQADFFDILYSDNPTALGLLPIVVVMFHCVVYIHIRSAYQVAAHILK
jgi:uncharacterized delta-60 repeat protein